MYYLFTFLSLSRIPTAFNVYFSDVYHKVIEENPNVRERERSIIIIIIIIITLIVAIF